ncbi:MAG: GIY-YIG nuclease family protein [Variovorax sp.]|nr:GIY-YIG nuclease family protein [Variovorax sp.]
MPGFLYLARNETRRQGLYKLGYSTQLPQSRMATLNDQIKGAVDFGTFRLIHAVPVGSSYDMEQALFEVLKSRRVVEKREFFFGSEKTFIRAMDALVRMPEDAGESVNDFLASEPWREEGEVPQPEPNDCDIPERGDPSGGGVYLCENFWHEPNTFYYSVSKDAPQALVQRLNAEQRALTSQVGFYRIVACRAVRSPDLVRRQAQALFAPFRLDTRKNFVRLPLAQARDIVEALDADSLGDETNLAPSSPEGRQGALEQSPHAAIAVSVVNRQRAHNSWIAWTKVCSGCGTLLRYQGKVGEQAVVACPVCSWSAAVRLGAQQVFVQ